MRQQGSKGGVLVYDSISYTLLDQIDSNGYRTHDLQVDIHNPDQFIIVNSGTPKHEASISWISLVTGKLVKQIPLDKPGYSPAHIWQQPNGEIYFTGTDNPADIKDETASFSVYQPGKEVLQVVSSAWEVKTKGETLNAYTDHTNNRIWLSSVYSDTILILDKSSYKILRVIDVLERPRSMVEFNYNGKRVLSVSYYIRDPYLATQKVFDLETFEEIKNIDATKREFYSIHCYPFHPLKKA
jgi:hypothetical protein